MKKIVFALAVLLLFQSCYSYKAAHVDQLETNKRYVIQLKRGGKEIDGKYISRNHDTIIFWVNNTKINFPLNEIQHIRRKKVSAFMIVGTVTAITVGTVILIDSSNNDKGELDAIPSPNN